ncbi:Rho termination factor N-terminal domain-containing protein [Nostoc sp.]|uniref:Rho termination factor N-terminal domain-containing protein n=1 Tax=Nostoc sp. TaxID=1180 RepID=UPI002FF952F3
MKEELQYPHIGQFYWQHFQQQDGKRNVAVSSTVPRVEMMLETGMVKEFTDKKREQSYSVLFDSSYVFDYFYQKIVLNMGWENNSRIDINVLRCFLDDFLLHCETKCSSKEQQAIEAQALTLSQQFPHKTLEQWKQDLMGDIKEQWAGDISHEADNEEAMESTTENEKVHSTDDIARAKEEEDVSNLGNRAEWLGEGVEEEKMVTMDDYDPDIEEDCGEWEPTPIAGDKIEGKSIRELKKIAANLKVKGYGDMKKDVLIAAIICNRD